MALRSYQKEAIRKATALNSLVILPTGSGKTRVGAGIIQAVGWPALFIVPKTILVRQQAKAIEEFFSEGAAAPGGDDDAVAPASRPHVEQLVGGRSFPSRFDVLVTTPAALWNNTANISWPQVRCVIFDECHHTRGDDPFALIANHIAKPENNLFPRVVGLSASLGYKADESDIQKEFSELTKLLRVFQVITFEAWRLEADGYLGHQGRSDTLDEYRCFNPHRRPREPVPHAPWQALEKAVALGKASPLETFLVKTVHCIELFLDDVLPLNLQQDPGVLSAGLSTWAALRRAVPLKEWGKAAGEHWAFCRLLALSPRSLHALPLLEALPFWYEAFRITAVSDPDGADIGMMYLMMNGQHRGNCLKLVRAMPNYPFRNTITGYFRVPDLSEALTFDPDDEDLSFYRLQHLRQCLIDATRHHDGGEEVEATERPTRKRRRSSEASDQDMTTSFRGIVFVEHRIVAHALDWWIKQQPDLSALGIKSTALFATTEPCAYGVRLTKTEMAERLQWFRTGQVNLLITTAVAEEGMDVPKANNVIRFDRVRHVVARVQGQGRAREQGSQHVLLQNHAAEVGRFDDAVAIGMEVAARYKPPKAFKEVEEQIRANLAGGPAYANHVANRSSPPSLTSVATFRSALHAHFSPVLPASDPTLQAYDYVSAVHRWRDQYRITHRLEDVPLSGNQHSGFLHQVGIIRLSDGAELFTAVSCRVSTVKGAKADAYRKLWHEMQKAGM